MLAEVEEGVGGGGCWRRWLLVEVRESLAQMEEGVAEVEEGVGGGEGCWRRWGGVGG